MDKKQPNKSGRLSAAEQQQLALLQQLGAFDPSMLGYGMPGCFDPTQLLNPLVNAQYPMMNPAALPAFSGLGRGSSPSTSGGADWLAMMQNQALAAGLGAGYLPGMFPGYLPPTEMSKQSHKSSTSGALKNRDEAKRTLDRMSPRSESRSPTVNRIQQERKSSHESHSSKDRPESRHSVNSPHRPSNLKHHDSKPAFPSWMNNNNRKMNEQAFQMEILRQFEQQILLQQLQIQQQQQQQQFNAALESLMSMQEKQNMSSRKDGETQKAQEQLNAMMAQLMQSGGIHGMTPAMSALLTQPGALETVLAMSQMGGNINSLPGTSDKSRQDKEPNRDQPSSSSSHNNLGRSTSVSHTSHKHSSPVPSSIMKMHEPSTSPRTSQHGDRTPKVQGVSIPGLSPTLTAGLSPDNAVLAMMYSQQLQYEEYIKKQLAATSKTNGRVESKASDHEMAHSSKKHFFNESSPRYKQSAHQHNAVDTALTKDKPTTSARHKTSTSPFKKSLEQDGDAQKASNSFTFKQPASTKIYEQESMSDTLKLLSTLASNPNLTQQEVATLLSIPPNVDPSTLLASLGPAASALIQPSLNKRQVTPADLENLNKNLSDALDVEKKKFQEQMKAHIEREMGKNVNHISVIHKNKFKTPNGSEEPSMSNTSENACNARSGNDGVTDIPGHSTQGDAASSDGDMKSEISASDRQMGSVHGRNTRPRIPVNEEVMAPLKHGWKREIRFKPFGGQLRGEVVYTTPDKRKLRMYADVVKYLDDNNIKDLSRSNFSFSTRLRLGTLLERRDGKDGNREWVEISEDDLEQQSHFSDRGVTSSPFADVSDRMSTYSSSSKGDSKHNKDKEQDKEKQKEQLRMLKEQEELRLEQQRMEREIRERLALEIERQRIAEDQRRQHLMLMRALESRKRAEERERRREELRIEKMLQREKKMEQRRIAMQIARELKMPVEDMSAIGAPELPSLTRLQGTYDNKCQHQLSGNACADLLMVLEFVKTFKECLRIDDSAILTFEQLQLGLLSDPKHTVALVRLTIALLHQCLCDPGVPAPGPWLHCLTGVKVTDIDVSEDNYSEILRLFIWARSGFKTEIAVKLETLSFLSLSADEKATSLAFLVNELVCSRPICMEIEKNLDTIATLKRDKWIVEGQMRQLRIAYEKNPATDGIAIDEDSSSAMSVKSSAPGNEMGDAAEENAESVFQKKMEELTQQHNSYNTQLASNSKPLRALDLGQDRFKRRYWALPNLGGVYVEGLESGISYEDDDESPDEDEDEDEVSDEESAEKDSDSGESVDERRNDSNTDDIAPKQKSEPMEVDSCHDNVSQSNFTHNTKSLDDPTASSKDIAKVLMMLSQEPVNHDIKNSELSSFEKPNEVLSKNGANNSHQTAGENLAVVSADPNQEALDAVTALNTMKANCETKVETTGISNLTNSFTPVSGHNLHEDKRNSCEITNSTCEKNGSESQHKNSEDSVIAAAKAIAAKAVASTSHLLFPKNESPPKLKPKKENRSEKHEDQKPHNLDAADNSTLPIGEHTINALVQMGLNPASLSSQQLEALSHLNIPMLPPNYESMGKDKSVETSSKPGVKTTHKSEADGDVLNKTEMKNNLGSPDTPVDFSKAPSSNTDTNSQSLNNDGEVKSHRIKTEAMVNSWSPFALQESPDPKSLDNKFFVPISFANGNKSNSTVKSEQEQYNQMVYSCPSPSILANYIISSANYGQLPPLDDIKFPIRPPDVKEEPDVIPRERKRGWWRIESESELRNFSEKLHLRGIREKQLHKNITKNFEFCTSSMVDSSKPEHQFTVLTKDAIPDDGGVAKDKSVPEKVKKSSRVVPAQGTNTEDIPSRFLDSDSSSFEAEIAVLKQVEELAARCSNMGIVTAQWKSEHAKPSMTRRDLKHMPLAPLRDQLGVEIKFDVLNPIQHDPASALGTAVQLLASLERSVCRRYLKPPLVRKGGASEFSSLPSLSESGALDVAAGLRTWRNAVVSSASASQVALCVRMLDACIAWDRSAAHQTPSSDEPVNSGLKNKKRKSDKRSTPKNSPAPGSPHPLKKKRKKKAAPIKIALSPTKAKKARRMPIDTADVISKSQVPEAPYTNGDLQLENHEADISNADTFEVSSNSATDESSNMLGNHVSNDIKNVSDLNNIGSPTFSHHNSDNMSDEYRPNSEPKKKKKKKKNKVEDQGETTTKKISKPRKRADKEVVICRGVLQELQSHEDATWFLFPVDCKLVPGYRKIIKKPIDFHTIESRLKRGRYKSKEEFVSEVRLVFDNCQKFNEDDSNIGRAGHNIRAFFEMRWMEVLKDKFGVVSPPEAELANISPPSMDTNHECSNEDEIQEDLNSSYQSHTDENIPDELIMDLDET